MKKIIFITVLAFVISCNDDSEFPFQSTGKITGRDYRYCACCGGYFIKIEDVTYRFFELPAGFDLENETFPVPVSVNWEKKEESCIEDLITITAIRKL